MRLAIIAIGKMKKGPETELVSRYADRIRQIGQVIGASSLDITEIPESRATNATQRKEEEYQAMLAKLPENGLVYILDERGKTISSVTFSDQLQQAASHGVKQISFIIGGPDGLSKTWRQSGHRIFSFGALTMPHQLVRVLLAEQLYRACSIASGHPYHRE